MPDSGEIFILDDDPCLGDLITCVLQSDGYRVTCFTDDEAFTLRRGRGRRPVFFSMSTCRAGRDLTFFASE